MTREQAFARAWLKVAAKPEVYLWPAELACHNSVSARGLALRRLRVMAGVGP